MTPDEADAFLERQAKLARRFVEVHDTMAMLKALEGGGFETLCGIVGPVRAMAIVFDLIATVIALAQPLES